MFEEIHTHTDRDGDEFRVEVDALTPDGHVMVTNSSNGYTPLSVYVPRAAFAEIAKTLGVEPEEPKRKVEDFAVEDVADPAKVALYMTARAILDPTGEGSVAAFEVENLANLIAKG